MIRSVVFDLDGTLLDTIPDLTAAMNHAMSRVGYPGITLEQARAYIGNGIKMFAKRAISQSYETDTDDIEADRAVAFFKEYYASHLVCRTTPYPGISETLSELKKRGLYLSVLSNKYDSATKHIINTFFPDTFDIVLGESDICKRKPDLSGFMLICEKTGCTPAETVMIGDSATDLAVAVNSGARPISGTWGYRSRKTLEEAGAVTFAENAHEIVGIIDGINGEK